MLYEESLELPPTLSPVVGDDRNGRDDLRRPSLDIDLNLLSFSSPYLDDKSKGSEYKDYEYRDFKDLRSLIDYNAMIVDNFGFSSESPSLNTFNLVGGANGKNSDLGESNSVGLDLNESNGLRTSSMSALIPDSTIALNFNTFPTSNFDVANGFNISTSDEFRVAAMNYQSNSNTDTMYFNGGSSGNVNHNPDSGLSTLDDLSSNEFKSLSNGITNSAISLSNSQLNHFNSFNQDLSRGFNGTLESSNDPKSFASNLQRSHSEVVYHDNDLYSHPKSARGFNHDGTSSSKSDLRSYRSLLSCLDELKPNTAVSGAVKDLPNLITKLDVVASGQVGSAAGRSREISKSSSGIFSGAIKKGLIYNSHPFDALAKQSKSFSLGSKNFTPTNLIRTNSDPVNPIGVGRHHTASSIPKFEGIRNVSDGIITGNHQFLTDKVRAHSFENSNSGINPNRSYPNRTDLVTSDSYTAATFNFDPMQQGVHTLSNSNSDVHSKRIQSSDIRSEPFQTDTFPGSNSDYFTRNEFKTENFTKSNFNGNSFQISRSSGFDNSFDLDPLVQVPSVQKTDLIDTGTSERQIYDHMDPFLDTTPRPFNNQNPESMSNFGTNSGPPFSTQFGNSNDYTYNENLGMPYGAVSTDNLEEPEHFESLKSLKNFQQLQTQTQFPPPTVNPQEILSLPQSLSSPALSTAFGIEQANVNTQRIPQQTKVEFDIEYLPSQPKARSQSMTSPKKNNDLISDKRKRRKSNEQPPLGIETDDSQLNFPCSECEKQFKRSEHLKRHIRSVHSNIRPFHCEHCDKRFSRSDNLAQHLKTHFKADGNGIQSITLGPSLNQKRRNESRKSA